MTRVRTTQIEEFYNTYKVKSPPLGKGTMGEIREGIHVRLNE